MRVKVSDNTKTWGRSMVAAAIGGGASSAGAIVIDPAVFNFGSAGGLKHILALFAVGALMAVLHYLAASPLPPSTKLVEQEAQQLDPNGNVIGQTKTSTLITKSPNGL